MAQKAPGFMWYPKDCDTDENVRMMDDREFGFYMRCLNHSWLNDGLPENVDDIGRALSRPAPYVRKVWCRVGKCFESDGAGRLRNPGQEKRRREQADFSDSRRKASEARWQSKRNPNGSPEDMHNDARALRMESLATASATASAIPAAAANAAAEQPPVHVDFEPADPGIADRPWVETEDAIRSYFPAADESVTVAVVSAVIQNLSGYQDSMQPALDKRIAQAVHASYQKKRQFSPMLFVKTVPQTLQTWADKGVM